MPLQRLFSASAPPAAATVAPGRTPEPRASAPDTDSTEVTVRWEQPTLQRAEETAEASPGAAGPPTSEGVTAALATTSPPPAKPGGTDLDELARRLYAPMSALLRAELWLDRERSGRSLAR
jgi:hypothetical protein